jgi:hypothetical protein
LKHTIDIGVTYTGDDSRMSTTFHGFTTAISWAFMLNNGPISFNSNTQHCNALSSREAEFVAAASAAQERQSIEDT